MSDQLDQIMTDASRALARMDYLTCEARCLEALALARQEGNWAYYRKILLPLQEARRQRRIIASEGVIRLGTGDLATPPPTWLDTVPDACIVLTRPHTADDAKRLHDHARAHRLHVEVLFADSAMDDGTWTLRSYLGPAVSTPFEAPPRVWRGRWLPSREVPAAAEVRRGIKAPATPADWFLDACEALGDAALQLSRTGDVAELEAMLAVAPDHEILHQRLGDAAGRAARSASGGGGRGASGGGGGS